tara:strand:- start:422 stop:1225 length:804 start_codon:yes stop_codon:yes gene_type:complete
MTQGNYLFNIFEKICRSNIYLFIFSRYLVGKFFSKVFYDNDFKIIKILEKRDFLKKTLILDIGANDGMSYHILRKFSRNSKIISFEPNIYNYKNLKKIEKKDKKYKCINVALSNKNVKKSFYTPYFKKYAITQIAGIDEDGVKKRLRKSLNIKNLSKKIILKKNYINTIKLDEYSYKPSFIKIDIEGHEFECIKGSIETIKKVKPILMVEYDKKICEKIYTLLKRYNYERFYYNKINKKIEIFNNQEIFNIFFINKKQKNLLIYDHN